MQTAPQPKLLALFDLAIFAKDNNCMTVLQINRKSLVACRQLVSSRLRSGSMHAALAMTTISALAAGSVANDQAASAGATSKTKHTAASAIKRWLEIGQASWYGLKFQGKPTATGEKFDMNSLTCAHRTLPLGSWIRVTNLRNKKTVLVRVNDRGPVADDRIIDLSYAAARAVGIGGLAKVKLETVSAADPELTRLLLAQLRLPELPVRTQ